MFHGACTILFPSSLAGAGGREELRVLGAIRKVEAALKLSEGEADRWEQLTAALRDLATELAPETREEGSVEAAGVPSAEAPAPFSGPSPVPPRCHTSAPARAGSISRPVVFCLRLRPMRRSPFIPRAKT